MGVSAIFVSALALHRLPGPRDPPQTQEDVLAMALQPVVGFIVLVSIVRECASLASAERSHLLFFFVSIIDGLSIPLWNFGNVIQSQREPTSGGFDECAGTSVQRSCDLSLVVSGGSLPLDQILGDDAPRLPPLALMRDESSIIHG